MEMLQYVKENNKELILELDEKKVLTDELVEEILKTVQEMRKTYLKQ